MHLTLADLVSSPDFVRRGGVPDNNRLTRLFRALAELSSAIYDGGALSRRGTCTQLSHHVSRGRRGEYRVCRRST
jgi:hypothetical protein